jgi:Ni,Fe-hydrogenase I cytochrome b subunit
MFSVLQSNESQITTFNEPHSLAIRIWHWSFFVVLAASLVTVLFGSTVFRTRDNISTVQEYLQEKGAKDVPWLKSWHKTILQIHSFLQYLIYSFILVHLVGVIRADLDKHRGIVSGMIHGQTKS